MYIDTSLIKLLMHELDTILKIYFNYTYKFVQYCNYRMS